MNILITNDDGIGASQLIPLICLCQKLGSVTAVVPALEQSAKSHSIEIRSPFEIKQVHLKDDMILWSVNSSPADCVRFAVSGLHEKYDLVISGINHGFNLGRDIMYSGTLAAASEAVNKGIPALALSTSIKYYDKAINHLPEILRFINDHKLLQIGNLYNINIPVDPIGIRITRMGGLSFRETFIPLENDFYFPGGKPILSDGQDITRDTDAVAKGFISITPMTIDRTDLQVFERISQINP